ncbi:MAG: M20 family metallopeptidase [bacterium]|nr:M20 family metallopeptidase [bacterium]
MLSPKLNNPMVTDDLAEKILKVRREIHQNPELKYKEFKTQKLILDELKKIGLKGKKIAGTGVTALIPRAAGSKEERVAMLRADMDALPMDEQTDLPFKSKVKGAAHACGHDAHVAMLLGAAELLMKNPLKGAVKLCFQPAEEGGVGSQAMIDDGVLENPQVSAAFGIHVWAGIPLGKMGIVFGPCMAAVDEFDITIKGIGGHAAYPQASVDPVYISSQVISALQSIITRNFDPIDTGVVTVASIHGGTTYNIIPPEVKLQGTCRTFSDFGRKLVKKRLFEIVNGVTKSLGGKAEIDFKQLLPATVNDKNMAKVMWDASEEVLGKANVFEDKPMMGGEDMSLYLQKVPGVFGFLGMQNPKIGANVPHHHPKFMMDERVLPLGVEVLYRTAEKYFDQ